MMFCNADLFPSPTYLVEMLAFFERRPAAGAAIGKILRYDLEADAPTDLIDTAGLLLNRQRRFMPRGEGERDAGQYDEELEVFAVDGAAWSFAARALESDRASKANTSTRTSSRTRRITTSPGGCVSPAGNAGTCRPRSPTTRERLAGSGRRRTSPLFEASTATNRKSPQHVQVNAMKNQWLMLLKNEDGANFRPRRSVHPGRELTIIGPPCCCSPRVSLAAVPMTLKLLPETLRKRRVVKRSQVMDPRELRQWLAARAAQRLDQRRRSAVGARPTVGAHEGA